MPAKRSLNLDDGLEENSLKPSKNTRMKKNNLIYSPTTGTCQMSLFASPMKSKEQKRETRSSNGKRMFNHLGLTERKESTLKDNEFMVLLSKVEKSSEQIMEIIQNLNSIQALEGNRELENLIGFIHPPFFLKREIQKTKKLMARATRQKQFEKKRSELPSKGISKKCAHYEHQLLHLPSHI